MTKRLGKREREYLHNRRVTRRSTVIRNNKDTASLVEAAKLAPVTAIKRRGIDVSPYNPAPEQLTHTGRCNVIRNNTGSNPKTKTKSKKDMPVFDKGSVYDSFTKKPSLDG